MSSHWIAAPRAENYPTDFDPRFDRPQPYQSKNRGVDQDVQDWEEIWVLGRWLNDEFQEMKGDARNRDNLCVQGGPFSKGVGNGEASESLTNDTNWTKVFGRLNGVYPGQHSKELSRRCTGSLAHPHMMREGKK